MSPRETLTITDELLEWGVRRQPTLRSGFCEPPSSSGVLSRDGVDEKDPDLESRFGTLLNGRPHDRDGLDSREVLVRVQSKLEIQ